MVVGRWGYISSNAPQVLKNLRSPPLTMAQVTCSPFAFDTVFADLDFRTFPLDLMSEVVEALQSPPGHEGAVNMAAEVNCGVNLDKGTRDLPADQNSPAVANAERPAPDSLVRSSANETTLSSTPAKDNALNSDTSQDTGSQPDMTTTPLTHSGSDHQLSQTHRVACDIDGSLSESPGQDTSGAIEHIQGGGGMSLLQDPLAHVPIVTTAPHDDAELEGIAGEGSSSEGVLPAASALGPDTHGLDPSISADMCTEAVTIAPNPETTSCNASILLAAPEEVTARSAEHVSSDGPITVEYVSPEGTGQKENDSLGVNLTPGSHARSTMNLRSTKRLSKGKQGGSKGKMTYKPNFFRS